MTFLIILIFSQCFYSLSCCFFLVLSHHYIRNAIQQTLSSYRENREKMYVYNYPEKIWSFWQNREEYCWLNRKELDNSVCPARRKRVLEHLPSVNTNLLFIRRLKKKIVLFQNSAIWILGNENIRNLAS